MYQYFLRLSSTKMKNKIIIEYYRSINKYKSKIATTTTKRKIVDQFYFPDPN